MHYAVYAGFSRMSICNGFVVIRAFTFLNEIRRHVPPPDHAFDVAVHCTVECTYYTTYEYMYEYEFTGAVIVHPKYK